MSRMKYVSLNFSASIINYLVLLVLKVIIRSTILETLGSQYLGIDGLFANILSVLGLAELGIGSAIIFNLYKPIAENDYSSIQKYMNFYKKAYQVIALVVTCIGLLLLPFLNVLIKDDLSFINEKLIFILYLLQSVSSYAFFAYKGSLLRAHQKEYIITIIGTIVNIVSNIIQIICLIIFRKFEIYVFITVISNIIQNICISKYSDKLYSVDILNDKNKILSNSEKKDIFKNCYSIFIYKINGVVVKVTDNIVLAKFIGLSTVGIYSNYTLIFSTFQNILIKLFGAMSASIGNLHTEGNVKHEKLVFRAINFFSSWISGTFSVWFICVVNNLISVLFGTSYLLGKFTVILIAIEIYMYGIMKPSDVFRTSMGLFQEAKYRPILCTVINLILSIWLVGSMGINGVIIGTILANTLTYVWLDPYIIYNKVFKTSVKEYYFTNLKYIFITLLACIISIKLVSYLNYLGVVALILKSLISLAITNLLYFLSYHKSDEFKYLLKLIYSFVSKKR